MESHGDWPTPSVLIRPGREDSCQVMEINEVTEFKMRPNHGDSWHVLEINEAIQLKPWK